MLDRACLKGKEPAGDKEEMLKVSLIWQRRFLRRRHTAPAIAILLACVCAAGCGTGSGSTNGSGSGGGNSQPVLGSITVAASQLSIPLNGAQ